MPVTAPWDSSEFLETEEDMIAYLNLAAEDNDPRMLQIALGNVAKARGMRGLAEDIGVGRESLYKSLSPTGNPSFRTIAQVIAALGGKISINLAHKTA